MSKEESDSFKNILQALDIIKIKKQNFGTIECPQCKGELQYRRFSNGHVHGKCKTENCLSWMQ